jgi:hypothetical protein
VIRDLYDGKLDRSYAPECYRQALDALPPTTDARLRGILRAVVWRAELQAVRGAWRRGIAADARRAPRPRFASPRRQVLLARLRRLARRDGFAIRSVVLRRPRQLAPEIVLRGDPRSLARQLPAILDAVDPPGRGGRRAYEAILIEVRDAVDVPAIAIYDRLRARAAAGQWARDADLYPFVHA